MPWFSFIGRWVAVGSDTYQNEEVTVDGLFKRIYLFGDATDEDIASVIKIATPQKYRQGELVFNEGDEADAMFIVEVGTVDMVQRKRSGGRDHWQRTSVGRSGVFQRRQTTRIRACQRDQHHRADPLRPARAIAASTARVRPELLPKRLRIFGQALAHADQGRGPPLFLIVTGSSRSWAVRLRVRGRKWAPRKFP